MDSLQNYYGKAIGENVRDVEKMSEAVWAIYYHTISTDEKPQHSYCPKGKESWCNYNQEVAKAKELEFRHKRPLPMDVTEAIYPVFKDLADPKLLERCLLGATKSK